MAASTITRATITDGVGGTIFNSAWVNSAVFDAVDNLLNTDLTIGGVFTAEGAGTNTFSAGVAGSQVVLIRNTTADTGALAAVHLGNDGDADIGRVEAYSGSYTPAGSALASGVALRGVGAGGVSVAAEDAAGAVRLYAAGTTKSATYDGDTVDLDAPAAGPYRLSGVLGDSVNTTATGNDANVDEKDLHSYTLPAGTLAVDGQSVSFEAFGTMAANTQTKTIRIYFGGTAHAAFQNDANYTLASLWFARIEVVRTGATAQKVVAEIQACETGSSPTGRERNYVIEYATDAETLSGALVFKVTGQSGTATANNIVAEYSRAVFQP